MALILSWPLSSSARIMGVGGTVNLGYRDQEISRGGKKAAEADTFYQRYSVATGIAGNIYNERSGPYRLIIGYNHESHHTDINGDAYSPSEGAFFWDVKFTLKLVQFKKLELSIFSVDRENIVVESGSIRIEETRDDPIFIARGYTVDQDFITGLSKTYHKTSGFRGKFGNNGGPKWYFYYVADKSSPGGKSNEAHLSINSGVNWIHFDRNLYYLRAGKERVKSIRIGNISYSERGGASSRRQQSIYGPASYTPGLYGNIIGSYTEREWYRVTNWLKVSADMAISEIRGDAWKENAEAINFLTKGQRRKWFFYTYPNYRRTQRVSQGGTTEFNSLSLPLWLDFYPSRYAEYFVGSRYYRGRTERNGGAAGIQEQDDINETVRAIIRPYGWLRIEPSYSLGKSDTNGSSATSHTVGINVDTSRKKRLDYFFDYLYRRKVADKANNDETTSYSHNARGRLLYLVSEGVSVNIGQTYSSAVDETRESKAYSTTLSGSANLSSAIRLFIDAARSTTVDDEGKAVRDDLSGILEYKVNSRLSTRSALNFVRRFGSGGKEKSLYFQNDTKYKVTKSLDSITRLRYNKSSRAGSWARAVDVSETLKYSYYKGGFTRRVLFDVSGGVWHRRSESRSSESENNEYFATLNYRPTPAVSCGTSYQLGDRSSSAGKRKQLDAYFTFSRPKLRLGVKYRHIEDDTSGQKTEDDTYHIDLVKWF